MIEDVGFWEKAMYALFGTGLGGYTIWRKLRNDNAGDKIDSKSQQLIDNLHRQIEVKNKETERLHSGLDRLSSERNEAVEKVGKLEATVQLLGEQIDGMKLEVQKLEKDNERLRSDIQLLMQQVFEFLQEAKKAKEKYDSLENN